MTSSVIIQIGAQAPWWIRAAANAALVLHVGGGCAGLVSGAISMGARKGGRLHRAAGRIFVASMLIMAAVAAMAAPFTQQRGNIVGGVFTFYLVLTGWQPVRRSATRTGWFELGSGLAAFIIAFGAWRIGWLLDHAQTATPDTQPAGPAYVLGAVALLAGVMDVRVARLGGLSGRQRLTRHLWRMCVAVFIAAGSFLLGQQQVFPGFVQGSVLLMVPVFVPLLLMAFWLGRVRFSPRVPNAGKDRVLRSPSKYAGEVGQG